MARIEGEKRYTHTVYLAIPLGNAEENPTDKDLQALEEILDRLEFWRPVSHRVTDQFLCKRLTHHLTVEKVLT